MQKSLLLLGFLSVFAAGPGHADIRLPRLVGDNMVLQRDHEVRVWGWADPGEKVHVRFRGQDVTAVTTQSGEWSVKLRPLQPGGPDPLVVQGKNTLTLKNVLVGDVWVASGQSNMAFTVAQADNAEEELAQADQPEIRLFTVPVLSALRPQTDSFASGWAIASRYTANDFSAIAFMFARRLHDQHRVPIGVILSSLGGTPAEDWLSIDALKKLPDFQAPVADLMTVSDADSAALDRYRADMAGWRKRQGGEDRGSIPAGAWAQPDLDTRDWSTIDLPQSWARVGIDYDSYGGILWLRKEITIAPDDAGKDMRLHLAGIVWNDVTYFNGHAVGATRTNDVPRTYVVPGQWVLPGRNVITVRAESILNQYIGIFGDPGKRYVETAGKPISLDGPWLYRTGADTKDMPLPPKRTEKYMTSAAIDTSGIYDTTLYNGMIAPLTPFAIKGVIWYQGETNAPRAKQYRNLFPALIQDWRKQWGYDVPFLYVQIAGNGYDGPEPADAEWAQLREAQAMTLRLPHTAMATAVDIGDRFNIHPTNKKEVARRLFLQAEKTVYGEPVAADGPLFQSQSIEGGKVRLRFTNSQGLNVHDNYGAIRGFAIAGKDMTFHWATARLDGQAVVVSSDAVTQPAYVRYDWSNTPDGNLYNADDLPMLPFRTDPAN